jgi:hypothetical protein
MRARTHIRAGTDPAEEAKHRLRFEVEYEDVVLLDE